MKYINGRIHIRNMNIMGSDYALTVIPNESAYVVNLTTRNEIEISLEEAEALKETTDNIANDFFNVCTNSKQYKKTYLTSISDKLDKEGGEGVFTDTTTIKNALFILQGNTPFYPDEILDFSTFTFLIVMFDKIFVDSSVRIPKDFSKIIFSVNIHKILPCTVVLTRV